MAEIRVHGERARFENLGNEMLRILEEKRDFNAHSVEYAVSYIDKMIRDGLTPVSMSLGSVKCTAYMNGDTCSIWWSPPYAEKNQVPKQDVAREMGEIFLKLLLD